MLYFVLERIGPSVIMTCLAQVIYHRDLAFTYITSRRDSSNLELLILDEWRRCAALRSCWDSSDHLYSDVGQLCIRCELKVKRVDFVLLLALCLVVHLLALDLGARGLHKQQVALHHGRTTEVLGKGFLQPTEFVLILQDFRQTVQERENLSVKLLVELDTSAKFVLNLFRCHLSHLSPHYLCGVQNRRDASVVGAPRALIEHPPRTGGPQT